jgi:hypothetical protein
MTVFSNRRIINLQLNRTTKTVLVKIQSFFSIQAIDFMRNRTLRRFESYGAISYLFDHYYSNSYFQYGNENLFHVIPIEIENTLVVVK